MGWAVRKNGHYLEYERMHSWAARMCEETTAISRCSSDLAKKALINEFRRRYKTAKNRYGRTRGQARRMHHLNILEKELA